jgi:hypothetical protein
MPIVMAGNSGRELRKITHNIVLLCSTPVEMGPDHTGPRTAWCVWGFLCRIAGYLWWAI